jgi:predicted nucleic acid-binding protein
MILIDTSVWIAHFKRANARLAESLENAQVLCHPFIVGELACGDLPSRASTITLLQTLPDAPLMQHEEVLMLVERHRLMGTGIGWVDAHLLGSALLAGAELWTLDGPLAIAGRKAGIAVSRQTLGGK